MQKPTVYDDLPFPFTYVPLPGQPVTPVTIEEVILPLVQTVHCVLDTFANSAAHGVLTQPYLASALNLLTSHLELAIALLQRLSDEAEAEAKQPLVEKRKVKD